MSMFNFFRQPITVTPRTGAREKGRSVIASGTDFTIMGSVHIAVPADLNNEDLSRNETGQIYKVITNDTLKITTVDSISDLVTYDGKYHEVYRLAKTKNNLIPHNVYMMQEINKL